MDHAGPGETSTGGTFYGPYDAQELVVKHQDEVGIELVPFRLMVYSEDHGDYMLADDRPGYPMNFFIRMRLSEARSRYTGVPPARLPLLKQK